MNSTNPEVSVILVAHNRKDYILHAMKSLSEQSLAKQNYEVIIVKNFMDQKIDDYAKQEGFLNIFTEVVEVGGKIAIGIYHSKGGIISILEDDDVFGSSKLEIVLGYFSKYKDLCFLHNSMVAINNSGEEIDYHRIKSTFIFYTSRESFLKDCRIGKISPLDLAYVSCISVKKNMIESYVEYLRSIQSAPDFFMVLAFLNFGCQGIHIPEKITKYRLHPSQSIRFGNYKEFVIGNQDIRRRWYEDYKIMESVFDNTYTKSLAFFLKNYNKLIEINLNKDRNTRKKFTLLLSLLKYIRIFIYYDMVLMIAFTIGTIFYPMGVISFYRKFRYAKYSSK